MQIEIQIDKNCTEPRLILVTSGMTEEVKDLLAKLSEQGPAPLVGFREGMAEILEPAQISRVMAQNGKVWHRHTKGRIPCGCACTRPSSAWSGPDLSASRTQRSST